MLGSRTSCWPSPRLRLGIVASLVVGLGGLAFVAQSSSPARTSPFAPQTAATFPSANKLLVAVSLTKAPDQELTGQLQVELLGADGKVVAQAEQAIQQKAALAGYRFEVPLEQAKAGGLTLRTRLGNQQVETPLAKVLLVKGHETDLVTGQEFFAGSSAPFRCEVHGVRSARETVPLPGAQVTVRLTARTQDRNPLRGQDPPPTAARCRTQGARPARRQVHARGRHQIDPWARKSSNAPSSSRPTPRSCWSPTSRSTSPARSCTCAPWRCGPST